MMDASVGGSEDEDLFTVRVTVVPMSCKRQGDGLLLLKQRYAPLQVHRRHWLCCVKPLSRFGHGHFIRGC